MKEKVNTKTKVALTPPFRGGWEGRSILDKIIADKRIEVASRKAVTSIADLEKTPAFGRTCLSLKQNLLTSASGIISEFKRKSPSLGWIHEHE